jgi:hypothetical protein
MKSDDYLQKEYNMLSQRLTTEEELEAYKILQQELVEEILNDVLVLIDGYGELDDSIDLIDRETNQSLRAGGELHDGFMTFLYEDEQEE